MHAGLDCLPAQLGQHETRRGGTDLVVALAHGGERGLRVRPGLQAVEADDREVLGDLHAQIGEALHAADRVAIGGQHERGDGHPSCDELLGHVAATSLAVVECRIEPLRVGFDPVVAQGRAVAVIARPHVRLGQVGSEPDAGVAVLDQVSDAGVHPAGVVGHRRRHGQAVDHVAGERHRLAGRTQAIEVLAFGRCRDRDDSVDAIPGGAALEVRGGDDLVVAQSGVERLDQHDLASNRRDLARDPGQDLPVVRAAGDRRENADRDRVCHGSASMGDLPSGALHTSSLSSVIGDPPGHLDDCRSEQVGGSGPAQAG